MKKLFFFLIVIITVTTPAMSQKENFNWQLSEDFGITFNTPSLEPVPVNEGHKLSIWGNSAISDPLGYLLFYSDGDHIYNKNHEIMKVAATGKDYVGGFRSFIIRKPGSFRYYYVISMDIDPQNMQIFYSIVDMELNNGLGAVTDHHIKLHDGIYSHVTANLHKNKKDIWLIFADINPNELYAYLLTEDGFSAQPVVNKISTSHNIKDYMPVRSSPSGEYIVITKDNWTEAGEIKLYKFDNETGTLTDSLEIDNINYKKISYPIEFSPDSRFLYVILENQYPPHDLYQLELTNFNINAIKNSAEYIEEVNITDMQTGPNGKIYALSHYSSSEGTLDVIMYPNRKGDNCAYKKKILGAGSMVNSIYLPQQFSTYIYGYISDTAFTVCGETEFTLAAKLLYPFPNAKYEWLYPDGSYFSSDEFPVIKSADKAKHHGDFTVKVITPFGTHTAKVTVTVHPQIHVDISTTSYCATKNPYLSANADVDNANYLWNTGETSKTIRVNQPGTYIVEVSKDGYCPALDSIVLGNELIPDILIEGNNPFCAGDTIKLYLRDTYETYDWSTGSTENFILVSSPGTYTITASDEAGCIGSSEIEIEMAELPEPQIIAPEYVCNNENTILTVEKDYAKYEWNTGETGKQITVNKAGKYTVTVTNQYGCIGSSEIDIPEQNINLTFDRQQIDFDHTGVMLQRVENLTITNNSTTDVTIDVNSSLQDVFKVISPSLPYLLPMGDDVMLEVVFSPDKAEFFTGILNLTANEYCANTYRITLTGNGMDVPVIILSLPDSSVNVNSFLTIPVSARLNLDTVITGQLDANITINADVFKLDENSTSAIATLSNGLNNFSFNIKTTLTNQDQVIYNLPGLVYLGIHNDNPILFGDIAWSDTAIAIEKGEGILRLKPVCADNLRRIQTLTEEDFTLAPNPVQNMATIILKDKESGTAHEIKIIDSFGRVIKQAELKPAGGKVSFDVSDIPSGAYRIMVTGAYLKKTLPMNIVR